MDAPGLRNIAGMLSLKKGRLQILEAVGGGYLTSFFSFQLYFFLKNVTKDFYFCLYLKTLKITVPELF